MKSVVVIMAFVVMLVVGCFASASKRYQKWLVLALPLPMIMWSQLSLMLFSEKYYRGSTRGMEIALPYLIALAVMVALAIRGKAGKFFADYGSVFFFLYWLLSLPSLMNCENMMYAWFEIWKVPMQFLVYRAVRGYCLETKDYQTPLIGLGIVAVANFLMVVHQHFFVHVSQARGLFAHQNSMAMWNVLAGAIFFAAFLNGNLSMKWRAFSFCFFASCAACFRSYSRGSMLALPFAICIVAFLSFRKNFHIRMASRLVPLCIIGILGMLLALPKIIDRFENASSNSGRMRVVFAQAAMRMVEDHPIAGVGLNNWGIKINPPYEYSQHREEFRMPPDFKDGIVETIYLLTWAECGTPCLIALLAFFLWHLCKAYKIIGYSKNREEFWIATGIFGGLCAIYLQSALEWVLKQSINFTELVICFGIIAAINEVYDKEVIPQHREKIRQFLRQRSQAKKAPSDTPAPDENDAIIANSTGMTQ